MTDEKQAGEKEEQKPSLMEQTRRDFLILISLGAGAIASAAVGIPLLGFLFAPLFEHSPSVWRPVGYLDEFKIGDTVEVTLLDPSPKPWGGAAAKTAAWLRRDNETSFTCFSVDCTHLGCPVRWEAQAELFMCPCHGGVYYKDGDVAAGPPPAPLQQYAVRVRGNAVEVQWQVLPFVAEVQGCAGCGDHRGDSSKGKVDA